MKKKLTISIDEEVIRRAKEYALVRGLNLSEIIENYLLMISSEVKETDISPEIRKLKGTLRLPQDADYKTILQDSLIKKHIK